MKIQYASDLHLEMPYNRDYWYENRIEPVGDILILAGDITKLSKVNDTFCFVGRLDNKLLVRVADL